MIRRSKLGSIGLATLLVLSVVWSAGALVGVAAAGNGSASGDATDDTRANATAVEMNSTVNASTETPDDVDWYEVEADNDQTLLLTFEALEGTEPKQDGPVEKKDLTVAVYGPDGEKLTSETTSLMWGENTVGAVAQLDESGTYYLKVSSAYDEQTDAEEVQEATGAKSYELQIQSTPQDEYEPNDDQQNATMLADGETVSAAAIGLEDDAYAVDLDAGETVTVTYTVTEVVNEYTWADYGRNLYVDGPNTTVFDSTETANGESVTFTAAESGTYYVTLSPNFDRVEYSPDKRSDAVRYDLTADIAVQSDTDGDQTTPEQEPDGSETDSDSETGSEEQTDSGSPDVGDSC